MILPEGHSTQYLDDYLDGKIQKGLGIGVLDVDRVIRYKQGQFNIILGHDNVGKTYWTFWYFLCLTSHHGLSWVVWTGENKPAQIMRDLIQMYSGKHFKDLTHKEVRRYEGILEQYFKFVDNSKLYTPDEMLQIFEGTDADGCFIDPYTGLDREFSHGANYQFLNSCRQFTNRTKKTLYLSTHPNSESGRSGRIYPKEHEYAGHLMPPLKDHVEGGKPFTNRVDDFIIIHRLTKHPEMKYTTFLDVAKVKDVETGGSVTGLDCPVYCNFNSGLGFTVGFEEGIKRLKNIEEPVKPLQPSMSFDKESDKELPEELNYEGNTGDDLPF